MRMSQEGATCVCTAQPGSDMRRCWRVTVAKSIRTNQDHTHRQFQKTHWSSKTGIDKDSSCPADGEERRHGSVTAPPHGPEYTSNTPDGVLQWWCGVCKGNKSCSALSWKARIISVLEDFEPRLDPLSADRAPMDGCGASVACLEVSARNQGSVRICIQAYYACSGCSLRLLWLHPGIRISGRSLRCSGLKIDWRRVCLRAGFFRGRPHRRQRRRPT